MWFKRLRLVAMVAMFISALASVVVGWATPDFLNSMLDPDQLDILVLLGTLLVIGPLIGVAEMMLCWERSSCSRDMKRLGQFPHVGMGLIAPGSFGLILGWAL